MPPLFFLAILTIILTNLVVGGYIAIRLGYGPPDLRTALGMLFDLEYWEARWEPYREKITAHPVFQRFFPRQSLDTTSTTPDSEDEPKAEETIDEEEFENVIMQLGTADLGDLLADDSDEISELAPMQELFDDDLATLLMDQGTEAWLVNEKHVETSLLKLNVVMMKSGKFASELDWRIRSARGVLAQSDIQQFTTELKDDCLNYLASQAEITEQMQKRLDEFGELKSLAEDIDFANMEQRSQIETTISNLESLNLAGDPEEQAGRLIKELASLRIARHRLRDMQDRAFLKIVFYEDRVDTIPQQLYIDEAFGIRGRIGLEVAIYEWWKQKRNETRQITFALLDFVRFGEANLEHGITVCDKIIKRVGTHLISQFDPLDLVGIYSGNCFMVATVNAGPKKTITEIERVRQRCERTTFSFDGGNNTLKLQLTCAVTEALATQTREEPLAALEKTMAAAKKAGRNHTFHYVPGPLNTPPEKVEAPNLGEEPEVIELD